MISLLCDSHRWRCCAYEYVVRFCTYHVCVRGMYAVTKMYTAATQRQQYNVSLVSSSCNVLVVTVYVCLVGAQQEIEPRQNFHGQRNNRTHIVGPYTRYTKNTAVAKVAAHTYHWNAHVSLLECPCFPFSTCIALGYQANRIPKGSLVPYQVFII